MRSEIGMVEKEETFLFIWGNGHYHQHNKKFFFLFMFVYYVKERFGGKSRILKLQVNMFLLITNKEKIEFQSKLTEEYSPQGLLLGCLESHSWGAKTFKITLAVLMPGL